MVFLFYFMLVLSIFSAGILYKRSTSLLFFHKTMYFGKNTEHKQQNPPAVNRRVLKLLNPIKAFRQHPESRPEKS